MGRRLGPRPVGLAVVALLIGALGLTPPFQGPTYELALAAGLLVPSVAAVVTALDLSSRQLGGMSMLARALGHGIALASMAYAMAFAHGLRVGFCNLLDGTVMFLLGPTMGCLLGGLWGAMASEVARRFRRRRLVAVLAGAAGPVGSFFFQLSLFYFTPAIFAFDPFVGRFSGALYDTVLSERGLVAYRLASLATLFAIYVASLHLERIAGRLRVRSLGRPGFVALGVLAAVGSLVSVAFGPELGHWQTATTIDEALGGRWQEGRCDLRYDRRLVEARAQRLARDCDAHVEAIETWIGAAGGEPVTVFLFHDRQQKRDLMGAAGTSVAKPWRREIYLNEESYPHPVVGHELVHALMGAFGRGPFDIAGSFGGLLPNPGLIEGVAVAGSPPDDTIGLHGWAAAMRELEVLPRVEALFSLSFFLNASSTSYIAAGSFVRHLHETRGADTVRAWYGGAKLTTLTGRTWEQLEAAWWQHLDGITVDEAMLATARRRFDRPSVLLRRCPHEVDEALAEAQNDVDGGDWLGAEMHFLRALAMDPSSTHARFGLASCHDRRGGRSEAEATLRALASDERLTVATRDLATERLAHLALRAGEVDDARNLYEAARARVAVEGKRRTIDLLHHYADVPVARRSLLALLIGTTERGPSQVEALDWIGRWRATQPQDGTPAYLMARQYLQEHRPLLAAAELEEALAKELPVQRVHLETLRLLAVARCATGERQRAERALAAYRDHPLARPSRVAYAERMVARCGR